MSSGTLYSTVVGTCILKCLPGYMLFPSQLLIMYTWRHILSYWFTGNNRRFPKFHFIQFYCWFWFVLLPRRSIWLPWHDEWTSLSSREGFYCLLRRGICSNCTSNGHEETAYLLVAIFEMGHGNAYPKVAPDPAIYCPKDRITPFGPAPYRIMLTEPKINKSVPCWGQNVCSAYRK